VFLSYANRVVFCCVVCVLYRVNRFILAEGNRKWPGQRLLLSFDLSADLRPLWDWNTGQLLVFVTASYATSAQPVNVVTVWDSIVRSKQAANLQLKNVVCNGAHYPTPPPPAALGSASLPPLLSDRRLHHCPDRFCAVVPFRAVCRAVSTPCSTLILC
jgi:hypothetical protein